MTKHNLTEPLLQRSIRKIDCPEGEGYTADASTNTNTAADHNCSDTSTARAKLSNQLPPYSPGFTTFFAINAFMLNLAVFVGQFVSIEVMIKVLHIDPSKKGVILISVAFWTTAVILELYFVRMVLFKALSYNHSLYCTVSDQNKRLNQVIQSLNRNFFIGSFIGCTLEWLLVDASAPATVSLDACHLGILVTLALAGVTLFCDFPSSTSTKDIKGANEPKDQLMVV